MRICPVDIHLPGPVHSPAIHLLTVQTFSTARRKSTNAYLHNFFQGKTFAVYTVSLRHELDSSFCSEASPDGAQRCAHDKAARNFRTLGRRFQNYILDNIYTVEKAEERYEKRS